MKHMKTKLIVLIGVLLISSNVSSIERIQFYAVFTSDSSEIVKDLIEKIEEEAPNSVVNAFTGALYMKLSSLLPDPKSKLNTFKKGRKLLEKEIEMQPNNIEYRFLRLAIQEQSPGFLRYKKELQSDKELIVSHFSSLDNAVQKQVIFYAKQSKILNPQDLKP